MMEILVSLAILSIVVVGLINVFVASKALVLHNRNRMASGQLGRAFLDPLQLDVNQSTWGASCLTSGAGCVGAQNINIGGRSINFTPNYTRALDTPATGVNRVVVTINWDDDE